MTILLQSLSFRTRSPLFPWYIWIVRKLQFWMTKREKLGGEEEVKVHMQRLHGIFRKKLLDEGGEEAVSEHYRRLNSKQREKLLEEGREEEVKAHMRGISRLGVEAKRKQREKLLEEGGEEAVREHYLRLAKKGGRLSLLEQVKAERKQLEEEAL